jgi:hypothetical protein
MPCKRRHGWCNPQHIHNLHHGSTVCVTAGLPRISSSIINGHVRMAAHHTPSCERNTQLRREGVTPYTTNGYLDIRQSTSGQVKLEQQSLSTLQFRNDLRVNATVTRTMVTKAAAIQSLPWLQPVLFNFPRHIQTITPNRAFNIKHQSVY